MSDVKNNEKPEEEIFEITADTIVVEVKDKLTGKVYRRELPIDFYENANLLKLSGENLDGSTAQLVFYSERGIQRLGDLTGKGPDADPCGTHNH